MKRSITDNSNLRWESMRMMLPEHKEEIIKLQWEQENPRVNKPELDDQETLLIGELIYDSLKHTYPVVLTYWKDGHFYDIKCNVMRLNDNTKEIKVEEIGSEDLFYIKYDTIYKVERV